MCCHDYALKLARHGCWVLAVRLCVHGETQVMLCASLQHVREYPAADTCLRIVWDSSNAQWLPNSSDVCKSPVYSPQSIKFITFTQVCLEADEPSPIKRGDRSHPLYNGQAHKHEVVEPLCHQSIEHNGLTMTMITPLSPKRSQITNDRLNTVAEILIYVRQKDQWRWLPMPDDVAATIELLALAI